MHYWAEWPNRTSLHCFWFNGFKDQVPQNSRLCGCVRQDILFRIMQLLKSLTIELIAKM